MLCRYCRKAEYRVHKCRAIPKRRRGPYHHGGIVLMAIKHTKPDWSVGAEVHVGFLNLRVTGIRAVHDGDIYDLESLDGHVKYEFIPHNGIHRVSS